MGEGRNKRKKETHITTGESLHVMERENSMQGFHGGRVKKQAVFQPCSSLPGSQWKFRREGLYTANASGLLGPPSLEESQSLSLSLVFVFAQYAQFFQVFSSQVLPTLSSYSFTVLFLFILLFFFNWQICYLSTSPIKSPQFLSFLTLFHRPLFSHAGSMKTSLCSLVTE